MRRLDLRKAQAAWLNTIRDINRQIVLNYVREREPISRAEIARETALQRSTISAIVEDLKSEGLVEEVGEGVDRRRRPTLLKLRCRTDRTRRFDPANRDHDRERSCRTRHRSGRVLTDADKTINQVIEIVSDFTARYKGSIEGVGVSLPGLVDPSTGNALYIPYFLWRDLPIAEMISTRRLAGCDRQRRQRRRACRTLVWPARSQRRRDFILVLVAEGVGTGIIFDGQVYRGQRGAAGEFGHMVIGRGAPVPCSCGSDDCWEAFRGACRHRALFEVVAQFGKRSGHVHRSRRSRPGW